MYSGESEKPVRQRGIGNWGLGIRGGVDADASTIIYGDIAQARVKSPYKSNMGPTTETYLAEVTLSVNEKTLPSGTPR